MRIAITGSTGFIGRRLVSAFSGTGAQVVSLSRHAPPQPVAAHFRWDTGASPPVDALRGCDAVIHLAGEPVAQRWSSDVKRAIRDSRVLSTRNLVQAAGRLEQPPPVLICASAVGFYGDRGEEVLTEQSSPGNDFLAQVCQEWEQGAAQARQYGMRHVSLRFGIVLGTEGGALKQMLRPFRMGMGGPVGSGRQWVPWIHVEDAVGLVGFVLSNPAISGVVNAVGPQPVRNAEFAKLLGAAIGKPAAVPAPEWGLKMLFGEMAKVVVASQRVVPAAAEAAGFQFRYSNLATAFENLLRPNGSS